MITQCVMSFKDKDPTQKIFKKGLTIYPCRLFSSLRIPKMYPACLSDVFEDGNYFFKIEESSTEISFCNNKKGGCLIFFENFYFFLEFFRTDDYMLACISKFADHFLEQLENCFIKKLYIIFNRYVFAKIGKKMQSV